MRQFQRSPGSYFTTLNAARTNKSKMKMSKGASRSTCQIFALLRAYANLVTAQLRRNAKIAALGNTSLKAITRSMHLGNGSLGRKTRESPRLRTTRALTTRNSLKNTVTKTPCYPRSWLTGQKSCLSSLGVSDSLILSVF